MSLSEILEDVSHRLQAGMSALDATQEAVVRLEDDPLFNAGKGAVYCTDGTHEFDASIMDGETLATGALGATRFVRNPILLARAIMDKTPHVLMSGVGAEALAARFGCELADGDYFHVPERLEQLERARASGAFRLDHDDERDDVYGTVGAVALDRAGNVACATSTGGMVNKLAGRIGDTPVMGAGFYASNKSCAVSATGHGESIIRSMTSIYVALAMELGGMTLQEASRQAIDVALGGVDGLGGLVAVDTRGHIAMPYNTAGMFRGAVGSKHSLRVAIWDEG